MTSLLAALPEIAVVVLVIVGLVEFVVLSGTATVILTWMAIKAAKEKTWGDNNDK